MIPGHLMYACISKIILDNYSYYMANSQLDGYGSFANISKGIYTRPEKNNTMS